MCLFLRLAYEDKILASRGNNKESSDNFFYLFIYFYMLSWTIMKTIVQRIITFSILYFVFSIEISNQSKILSEQICEIWFYIFEP